MQSFSKHLQERASQEKKVYASFAHIDMCGGDIVAGILLSQIVFWFTPNKEGANKITIRRGPDLWLAKKDSDWKHEIRLSVDQARRARALLVKKGLIKCETHKFKGVPQVHIRVIEDAYMTAYDEAVKAIADPNQVGLEPDSDSGQNPSSLGPEPESLLSEITAETTTERTKKPLLSEPSPSLTEYQNQYLKAFRTLPRISKRDVGAFEDAKREYGLTEEEATTYIKTWGEQWKAEPQFWPASLQKFDGALLARLDKIRGISQAEQDEILAEVRRFYPDYKKGVAG